MKKYVSVYFDVDIIDKVKELAKEHGRSFNNMLMFLLRKAIAEIEKERGIK